MRIDVNIVCIITSSCLPVNTVVTQYVRSRKKRKITSDTLIGFIEILKNKIFIFGEYFSFRTRQSLLNGRFKHNIET